MVVIISTIILVRTYYTIGVTDAAANGCDDQDINNSSTVGDVWILKDFSN